MGVLSIHGSFDKLFHPFYATKAESRAQVLRVFSKGANIVGVLSVENLWVVSTDLERSLERAVLGVPSADCFFSITCYFFDQRAEFMSASNRRRRPMGDFLKISTFINV